MTTTSAQTTATPARARERTTATATAQSATATAPTTAAATATATSRRYHHGDLRNALVRAGVELAREGGPPAIVLREAARRVGVSPNAAYRHFADLPALVEAVAEDARITLGRSMRDEIALVRPVGDPYRDAVERFNAVGRAYISFALAEPGLFASAFLCEMPQDKDDREPESPDTILNEALDALLAAGVITPANRAVGFAHAWAGVHGLANLLLGPLAAIPTDQRDLLIDSTVNLIGQGLFARD